MKRLTSLLTLSVAIAVALVGAQGILCAETPLTDYSRAVMLENPTYYWTFNETGATDAAEDVMRYESQGQMIPCVDAARVAGATTELGNAASFNDNAAYWANLVNRGQLAGAYAIEYWVQANDISDAGYMANFLGSAIGGDSPSLIYGFNTNQMEMFFGNDRTGVQPNLQLSDSNWHHVAFTVYGDGGYGVANRIDVAVDGNLTTLSNVVDSKMMDISGVVSLGACFTSTVEAPSSYVAGTSATAVWDGFNGNLDEVAIYDLSGLSEAEVAAKANAIAGHYGLASNPVAITEFAPVPANEVSYTHISGTAPQTGDYGDAGSDLSDGIYSSGYSLMGSVVGFQAAKGATTEYEFDLGEVRTLSAVWVDYFGAGGTWGLYAPESASVSYSEDGVNFTAISLFEDFNDTPESYNFCERKAQIAMGDVDAQYVRIAFANSMDSTSSTNFMFLSEVQFIELSEVPEPSTIVLMLFGCVTLLIRRRFR